MGARDDVKYLSPPDPPSRPKTDPPPGATDCHAHVFGPFDRYPLAGDRGYTPAELPGARYVKVLDEIGFSRGVLVTASAYGTDNRAMLEALRLYPQRLRGVAVITPDVTSRELQDMHDLGVRGVRFSEIPIEGYHGTVGFDALKRLAPRLAEMGWHAQIWTFCDILKAVAPDLLQLGLPLVVDHMGIYDCSKGVGDAGFQRLLELLRNGQIWLKLTAYRLSNSFPAYPELAPFHRALLNANPDHLVWGSDWPHVNMTSDIPDVGHLLDLLAEWTQDGELVRRILVSNPARLYGFEKEAEAKP